MLARSLERLGDTIEAAVAAVWRRYGLSHAAGNALAVIEGAGAPTTPGEISAAMHITSASITSLLDTLERRGLVVRSAHAEDRRKVLVAITTDGQTLLDEGLPEIQQVVRRLFHQLSDGERTRLLELVQRTYDSVTSADLTDLPAARRNRPPQLGGS